MVPPPSLRQGQTQHLRPAAGKLYVRQEGGIQPRAHQQEYLPPYTVTNEWYLGNQNQLSSTTGQKDFVKSNKLTVKYGIHTSKDQTPFRMSNNIEVRKKYGSKNIPLMLPEESHVYGEANRPSTPVKLVVGNCYGLIQEDKNRTMYETRSLQKTNNKLNSSVKVSLILFRLRTTT